MRAAAVRALGAMGAAGWEHRETIATALRDEDPSVRCAGLEALMSQGEYGGVLAENVVRCVGDAHLSSRALALAWLAQADRGTVKDASLLVQMLASPDVNVRWAAKKKFKI